MTWNEARDTTLHQWLAIRESLPSDDPVALLTEINVVCDLCQRAGQAAGGDLDRCQYCIFYQQLGGCREVNAQMSEGVVAKDWERVRSLVDAFIANLRRLEVPPEAVG